MKSIGFIWPAPGRWLGGVRLTAMIGSVKFEDSLAWIERGNEGHRGRDLVEPRVKPTQLHPTPEATCWSLAMAASSTNQKKT